MKLENSFTVPVPVDQAWKVLQDVERIAPCMPGATLDTVDGDSFTGRVKVKVGPIMLTYSGKATFADKDEAKHAMTIQASGKETRGSGTAKATVQASMQADGDSTKVLLVTDLAVTGKPAQFGRGVMADVSGKLIDQFAKCLGDEVQSGAAGGATAEDAAAGDAATSASAPAAEPTPAEPAVSSVGATPAAPAAPPLPPSGAPQPAASAPATPLPATGLASAVSSASSSNGAAPSAQPAAPSRPRPQQAEAIDLLGTAGMPVAKRLAPIAAAVVVAILLIRVLRRR